MPIRRARGCPGWAADGGDEAIRGIPGNGVRGDDTGRTRNESGEIKEKVMWAKTRRTMILSAVALTAACDGFSQDAATVAPAKREAVKKAFHDSLAGLDPGYKRNADITVIDPAAQWTIDAGRFVSLSRNCPFDGMKVVGRAEAVIVGGAIKEV